jgi:hypothetical protein
MRDFQAIDPHATPDWQKSIEEYPNYLGHTREGLLLVVDEIEFLNTIDWELYRELTSTLKDPIRHFNIEVGLKSLLIPMDPSEDLVFALDEIPSLDVQIDKESATYIIFLKDGFTYEEAFGSILSFAKSVEADIEHLQDLQASQN